LSKNVRGIGLKWLFRNLFLFDEINYDQLISEPPGQTFPRTGIPGIAYVSYHFELALGTQFDSTKRAFAAHASNRAADDPDAHREKARPLT
jgi:hypothetical protein